MTVSPRRLRSIGWFALLALCVVAVMVLTLRVNAIKSEVRREENRIVALRQETTYLQTEFKTRANMQQLRAWNDVDFGFVAPIAGQYLENERQLAVLGKPEGPDAPPPVRVAALEVAGAGAAPVFPGMVSPLTGKPMGAGAIASDANETVPAEAKSAPDHATAAARLDHRLGHVDHAGRVIKPGQTKGKGKSAKSAKAPKATKPKAKGAKTAKTAAHAKPAAKRKPAE